MLPALYDAKQVDLIRRTVAKDCNAAEFDQFIHMCRAVQLDPLRRQVFAFVFHKDKPDKRQLTIVTAIGGLRAIADRTGSYRPDDRPARIEYDPAERGPLNPLGIVRAEVTVFKWAHGDWFPVTAEAYWSEYAPINYEGTALDPKKQGWTKMPRVMIAKVAEAQALRKAWPDDFAGIEEESEIDRRMVDITPSEAAEQAAADSRFALIGGRNAITVDWCDGGALCRVPAGQFGDQALNYIKNNKDEPLTILTWLDRNRDSINEYWAMDKAGALALKRETEPFEAMRPKGAAA